MASSTPQPQFIAASCVPRDRLEASCELVVERVVFKGLDVVGPVLRHLGSVSMRVGKGKCCRLDHNHSVSTPRSRTTRRSDVWRVKVSFVGYSG